MSRCPVIRTLSATETRPAMRIHAGLHYIKGNKKPYFSITAETRDAGGCLHEDILKRLPSYRDLVEMHLSDIDGVPHYAVENGWFRYGGTHWEKANPKILAGLLRIDVEAAEDVIKLNLSKEDFTKWVEGMYPRYHAEAAVIIKKYHLEVCGDHWNV